MSWAEDDASIVRDLVTAEDRLRETVAEARRKR